MRRRPDGSTVSRHAYASYFSMSKVFAFLFVFLCALTSAAFPVMLAVWLVMYTPRPETAPAVVTLLAMGTTA